MSKILRNQSYMMSSFHSSNSYIRFDDDMYSFVDSRVPKETEVLSTGLELVLDDVFVNIVWTAENKKEKLQDLLVSQQTSSHPP